MSWQPDFLPSKFVHFKRSPKALKWKGMSLNPWHRPPGEKASELTRKNQWPSVRTSPSHTWCLDWKPEEAFWSQKQSRARYILISLNVEHTGETGESPGLTPPCPALGVPHRGCCRQTRPSGWHRHWPVFSYSFQRSNFKVHKRHWLLPPKRILLEGCSIK